MKTQNKNVYTMPCKPGSVFVNFGDACLNDCRFCVERFGNFFGYNLEKNYSKESLKNIESEFERIKGITDSPNEVVICGIGEPFLHYNPLIKVSKLVKKTFGEKTPVRADTTGLWWEQNKNLSFLDHIDSLSISLNAESAEKYNAICQPKIEGAYDTLTDFLGFLATERQKRKQDNKHFPTIRLTAVNTSEKEYMPPRKDTDNEGDCPVPDFERCYEIADSYGFPLVVKHLFRDVNANCWNPKDIEELTLNGGYLEKCNGCKFRHI